MPEVKGYSGDFDPVEFARVYEMTVAAAGGNKAIMAKCLPLVLSGVA